MAARISARFFSSFSKIASVSQPVNRIITVEWADGVKGKFPVTWLRDCSPDPATFTITPAMKARNLTMEEFDVEQNPKSVRVENDQLVIDWETGAQSRFNSDWLFIRNPSDELARKMRQKVYLFPEKTWGKEEIERRLQKFDYVDVMADDKTLHDFLEAVCLDGIAVIKNGPIARRKAVPEIGERIGQIHNTHFGRVFEVATKPNASNMAYASREGLPFHTDFPSLADPPQLQMLHMVERAQTGGNSLFVDGFHIAEQLREEKPEVFEILTKYLLEFIEEGFDVHEGIDGKTEKLDYNMCARHRTITLDETGRVVKIIFGNAMRSWFYDCDPEEVQGIYRAMKTFMDYCYQERNVLKFALEEGDTVLWANTRLLHTRDSYRNAPNGNRTLTGCYFSWDIVKSKVRVLRRKLALPSDQPSI